MLDQLDQFEMSIDGGNRKQATLLAKQAGLEEPEHTVLAYSQLLCQVVQMSIGLDDSPEFSNVARFVCSRAYRSGDKEVRKRIATNALSLIHEQGKRVGDVEDMAEMSNGHLAKVKQSGDMITPRQIVYLATELSVPIGALSLDSEHDENLLKQIVANALTEEVEAEPSAPVDATEVRDDDITPAEATMEDCDVTPVSRAELEPDEAQLTKEPAVTSHSSPPSRQEIGRNIRAAVKKAERKLLETLAEAGVEVDKMFMAQFEKGRRELTDEQLARVAELTGVTVAVLHSGEGLEAYVPNPKRSGGSQNALVSVMRTIELPPISDERMNEFFRGRVFHISAEPGVNKDTGKPIPIGELLALGAKSGEVNFIEVWQTMTKEGQDFMASLEKHASRVAMYGEVAKTLYLIKFVELVLAPKK